MNSPNEAGRGLSSKVRGYSMPSWLHEEIMRVARSQSESASALMRRAVLHELAAIEEQEAARAARKGGAA